MGERFEVIIWNEEDETIGIWLNDNWVVVHAPLVLYAIVASQRDGEGG